MSSQVFTARAVSLRVRTQIEESLAQDDLRRRLMDVATERLMRIEGLARAHDKAHNRRYMDLARRHSEMRHSEAEMARALEALHLRERRLWKKVETAACRSVRGPAKPLADLIVIHTEKAMLKGASDGLKLTWENFWKEVAKSDLSARMSILAASLDRAAERLRDRGFQVLFLGYQASYVNRRHKCTHTCWANCDGITSGLAAEYRTKGKSARWLFSRRLTGLDMNISVHITV